MISPGPFSVPPVIGTSVEHDMHRIAKALYPHHVVVYTRTCDQYPKSSQDGHVHYRRFDFNDWRQYLREVMADLKIVQPHIIHGVNRPQYITILKEHFPHQPLVLSMHSLQYTSPQKISQNEVEHVLGTVDALITNSVFLQEEYERRFPMVKGKAFGIHLGIELSPYIQAMKDNKKTRQLRKKYGLQTTDQVVLFVGRIMKYKGVHLLIEAMQKVLVHHPQVKLFIVGSVRYGHNKPSRFFRMIKKEARKYGDRIVFTQFIKPEDIPPMYQLANMVVTPSIGKEAFCRVNLEAMASRKPVVTTEKGGIPEVVVDQQTGYVLSIHDLSTTLPTTIIRLLQSDHLQKRLGTKGWERAKTFTWKKTATQYIQVYRQLLSRPF